MELTDASVNLRSRYKSHKENRSRTILLSNVEFFAIHEPTPTASNQRPVEKKCRAHKMDGHVCNALVKTSGDFCRRHAKKQALT
jgi:hypothetical protein